MLVKRKLRNYFIGFWLFLNVNCFLFLRVPDRYTLITTRFWSFPEHWNSILVLQILVLTGNFPGIKMVFSGYKGYRYVTLSMYSKYTIICFFAAKRLSGEIYTCQWIFEKIVLVILIKRWIFENCEQWLKNYVSLLFEIGYQWHSQFLEIKQDVDHDYLCHKID